MKNIVFLFTLLLFIFNKSFSQGYVPETNESVASLENYSKEGFGFAEDIPSAKSLVKYVPPIGNQRQTGSCAAWATTYYATSIVYNRMFGITSYRDKWAHSFDPWFTYSLMSIIEGDLMNCENGTRISGSLELLERYGPKKIFLPPRNYLCNESFTDKQLDIINRTARPFAIDHFEYESAYNQDAYNYPLSNSVVNKVKTEIGKYAFPVVAGFSNFQPSVVMQKTAGRS